MKTAAVITIGDELLIGQVMDTNSNWIAQQLNQLGIQIIKRLVIGDEPISISESLDYLIPKVDLIIITGGLGPTKDDLTKNTLCNYFGGKLLLHEKTLEHVTNFFLLRNKPMLDINKKQAEVPNVCQVIDNPVGTAPGMLFKKDDKIVISLPGVPFEMKYIMEQSLLPYFQSINKEQYIFHQNILTFGLGESFLADKINDIEEQLPASIKLAYLPTPFFVKLRLTVIGNIENKDGLHQLAILNSNKIADRLKDNFVSFENLPLEVLVANTLKENNLSIGLAESCTAGLISHQLTQYDGASTFFKGCIVCYATEIKTNVLGIDVDRLHQEGIISEYTAYQMAKSAISKLSSDIGVGITGKLSNSTYEDNAPNGLIYISIVHKNGKHITRKFNLNNSRIVNKETATQIALFMIFNFVKKINNNY